MLGLKGRASSDEAHVTSPTRLSPAKQQLKASAIDAQSSATPTLHQTTVCPRGSPTVLVQIPQAPTPPVCIRACVGAFVAVWRGCFCGMSLLRIDCGPKSTAHNSYRIFGEPVQLAIGSRLSDSCHKSPRHKSPLHKSPIRIKGKACLVLRSRTGRLTKT